MDELTINFNISFTERDCECIEHIMIGDEFFAGTYNRATKNIFVYLEMHVDMLTVKRITSTLLHELIHWGGVLDECQTDVVSETVDDWMDEDEG